MQRHLINMVCKECHKDFVNDRSLHTHLKAHKVSIADYYVKNFGRFDKYDNQPIKFKDKEQYFSDDFNSKENMRLWFKSVNPETAKIYAKELLLKRKEEKDLKFAPSQVELRTINSPSIVSYDKLFGNYYKLCQELKLTNKYENSKIDFDLINNLTGTILVDTREQNPLSFSCEIEVASLNFGDYSYGDLDQSGNIYIERKSANDFISTFGHDLERFKKEIERAKQNDAYLIVIVEEALDKMLEFNKLGILPKNAKVKEAYIFHNMRELCQSFDNIQFVFVKDRKESANLIEKIFAVGNLIKRVDIQLQIDLQKL